MVIQKLVFGLEAVCKEDDRYGKADVLSKRPTTRVDQPCYISSDHVRYRLWRLNGLSSVLTEHYLRPAPIGHIHRPSHRPSHHHLRSDFLPMTNRSGPCFLRHRYGPNILQRHMIASDWRNPRTESSGVLGPRNIHNITAASACAWGQAEWRPKLFHRPPMGI